MNWLEIFTLVMCGVAFVFLIATIRIDRETRRIIRDMEKLNERTEESRREMWRSWR
ncbi:hypothetical protein AVMA1855_20105 [Acidovorax sp. SUPP1855]|uniref:hypothetical protein n=1 Tax=Acidovorax sp. SUPP1855 TaxID=431774 RepID=UPI0023DE62E8|nr:hypothetical protein [Acidovorax sp. SUPP1855]GKS86495.1 hypothetical protein AVMA1855_20105 [Acidovorax sp. SUPP1855]